MDKKRDPKKSWKLFSSLLSSLSLRIDKSKRREGGRGQKSFWRVGGGEGGKPFNWRREEGALQVELFHTDPISQTLLFCEHATRRRRGEINGEERDFVVCATA